MRFFSFFGFFLCLFSLSLAPQASWARSANGCPNFSQPRVGVMKLATKPAINDSLNLTEIRQLAMDGGKQFSKSRHETPVGLTSASLKMETRFQIQARPAGHKFICGQITNLQLSFGFDDTIIYMPREMRVGTCTYNIVLGHEQRHVDVDRRFTESYANIVRDEVFKMIGEIGMVRAGSSDEIEDIIRGALDQRIERLGLTLSERRKDEQAKVDTPQEYARLAQVCGGDLKRLMKKAQEQGL